MTSKSRASLDALHALFAHTPFFLENAPEVVESPTNLDESISSEEGKFPEVALFRWFRGTAVSGVRLYFKFQRGLPLGQWQEMLTRQQLRTVEGPYRTLVQAQNAPESAAAPAAGVAAASLAA